MTAMLCGSTIAYAAPLSPRPLGELLGLRNGTAGESFAGAPVAASPSQFTANTPMRHKDAAAGVPVINASVIYPDNAQGMWSYSTTGWDPVRLSVNKEILATGGGIEAKGYYYITRYREILGFEEIATVSYDTSGWAQIDSYNGKINYVATTMAYSHARDEVYGCFINEERTGYNFVRWNYDRFLPAATICPLERPWSGCAFSSDGTLYAIERNGDLYTVNLRTGAMTLVGSTGIESSYLSDATIDTATDKMYWCVSSDNTFALYTVDLTTATATRLYDLANQEQLCGMYIPVAAEEPAAGAPAKIQSVNASFSGTSMSGKIQFYAPRYTVDQTLLPADEEITYVIKANGKEIATGTCLPNKRAEAAVTMEETDNYYFTVTTSNDAGTSPVTGVHKFVGPDSPKAPNSFQATISGNTVNLQWSSPSSTGVNGGNVNTSAATYTVVRYPDMKTIAEGISERKISDELPSPETRTEYYYELSTTVEGLNAPAVKSPVMALGPIIPPYSGAFNASTDIAGWTIVDANADETKWTYSNSYKALQLYGSRGFNDWAITPAIKAKNGTSYPVTVTLKTSNYAEETFEVMWGTEPTVEAMTNTVIASTPLKSSTPTEFTGEISGTVTGTIYVGIHATTEGKSNTLQLIGISIESGLTSKAPAAPADFTVTSPSDGSRSATVTFKAPATDISGAPLEADNACTAIDILRDGQVIVTLTEGIGAGEEVEYTDSADDLTLGKHIYGALPRNAFGEGVAVEAEVLVGARKPVAPASAKFIEDGNTGKVTVMWEAVTTDIEGNTISPEAVTYRVIDRQMNTVADNLTGNSVTLQAVEEGTQAFCQFGVYAVTVGGESDKMAATDYKPVGEPYATPWNESFKDRTISSIFGYNYISGNEPWQFLSSSDWGIMPQDEDNGFAYFECYNKAVTGLVTGKINLSGLVNPAFTYYTFNYVGSSGSTYSNAIEIQADNGDGNGFVPVQCDVVAETGEANKWNKVVVPLSSFEEQSVIFRIIPKDGALAFFTIDNLRVSSYVEHNLSCTRITAPRVADVNKPFEIDVTVTNTGESSVQSFSVELWKGEELVEVADGPRTEPGESKTLTFEATAGIADGEEIELHAMIVCGDDEMEEDNTSETLTVGVLSPAVPHVTDLTAYTSEGNVTLGWSEPDLSSAAPEVVTETFENAESWGNAVNGWKFVDMDKAPVGGIQITGFPCTGMQSWFVADASWSGYPADESATWDAHSGNKFIASEYVVRGGENVQSDDWAITPRLFGCPQGLSLYARSFMAAYLESFEVLASDNTTNPDDFVSIATVTDVPSNWVCYRFKLPEGTKYAAIRSRSFNRFFLFVDDVAFIPADGTPAQLSLTGYHIYRNGIRVTDTPVTETTFTDTKAAPGREHTYFVTAVYDKGESRHSNKVGATPSGIGSAATDDAVSITATTGKVIVRGLAEGTVKVTSTDGRTVALQPAAPTVRVSLPAGIYIVTAGTKVAKVAVK